MLLKSFAENLKVKKSVFYTILRHNFNIGFGSPASGVCSLYFRKKKEPTYSEGSKKISIMTELRIHKLRAKQFNLLAGRGANEVASALTTFLRCNVLPDCKVLRLFADGCAGQNKNSYVLYPLAAPSSVQEIRVTFPVRGHSFLPADRIFGRLEKQLRTFDATVNEQEYQNIFIDFGTVMILYQDQFIEVYEAFDKNLKKLVGIRDMKHIIVRGENKGVVKIKMEPNYRNEATTKKFEAITKKSKN
nr:unnamed protein product [Callosobruchus analis]